MSWFNDVMTANHVTGLTTLQVINLFIDNSHRTTKTNQGLTGQTGSTPLYTKWSDAFTAWGWTVPTADQTAAAGTIQRAVRDPTSGTYDCFNNYFAAPNGYAIENKATTSSSFGQTTVVGSQEMAPFTYDQENANIFTTVSTGTNYVGFISLGYLLSEGVVNGHVNMIGLNIAYNMANVPSSLIAYPGTSGTYGFVSSSVQPTWGAFIVPNDANVIYAYSGVKGSQATGQYEAWRWLWEVTPDVCQSTGPTAVAGVWIAYMMADGTTQNGVAVAPGTGNSNFVADQNYIPLDRCDMAGGPVVDSNLATYTPNANQTQTFPDGKVNFNDITYFVSAYIAYYTAHIYNPYADLDANGAINFNDITAFVSTYIAYYTTYNPQ